MTEIDLPQIDISQFPQEIGGDHFQYQTELAKLTEACKEWGFFLAVNHGIPADLLQKVVSVVRDLVSMPVEVKDRATTSNPMDSYVRLSHQEHFCFVDMPNAESIQEISRRIWPEEGNPNFCEVMGTFSLLLSDLAAKIMKSILESLGLDARTFYQAEFGKCKERLYINAYSSHGKCNGDVALGSHTDIECVTILYPDEMESLEVLSKEGKWLAVKPTPNSFVVNIGDSLKAWSNGRYCSADHRVVYTGWKNRMSLPYSISFPDDTQIWAPKELVDENNPRRYKPFMYSELVREYYNYQVVEELSNGEMAKAIERVAGI